MSHQRNVNSLPIPPHWVQLLLDNGFRTLNDLQNVQPFDLANETKISNSEALQILQCVKGELDAPINASHLDGSSTAKELLGKAGICRPIITFCREMDVMLGGGVPIGQITEFCGVPGIGKTQLGIQLALTAQIPEVFNGSGGNSIYIDTEGSLIPERVAEMAKELSTHLNKLAKLNQAKSQRNNIPNDVVAAQIAASENMSMERFLEGITVYRCHDQSELLSAIHNLRGILNQNKTTKILVIDSIAFNFRQDLQDLPGRNRVLSSIAQELNQLAHEHSLAVVLVNHVTTKIVKSTEVDNEGIASHEENVFERRLTKKDGQDGVVSTFQRLVPALGDTWSHSISQRVMLHWASGGLNDGNQARLATLVKSPSMPNKTVTFAVTAKGIRDAATNAPAAQRL